MDPKLLCAFICYGYLKIILSVLEKNASITLDATVTTRTIACEGSGSLWWIKVDREMLTVVYQPLIEGLANMVKTASTTYLI